MDLRANPSDYEHCHCLENVSSSMLVNREYQRTNARIRSNAYRRIGSNRIRVQQDNRFCIMATPTGIGRVECCSIEAVGSIVKSANSSQIRERRTSGVSFADIAAENLTVVFLCKPSSGYLLAGLDLFSIIHSP
ncbi:hypothetical protein HZH66_011093 [Vespula vulgaris]|uniref:Uncharacterized protein n=1 Tax=Vespula vulgaris TaxID=7454 RepID=A0A834JJK3_VESVU|nr:hypothetical protein HZH66_011093 [Vespula vulgaris]